MSAIRVSEQADGAAADLWPPLSAPSLPPRMGWRDPPMAGAVRCDRGWKPDGAEVASCLFRERGRVCAVAGVRTKLGEQEARFALHPFHEPHADQSVVYGNHPATAT